MEQIKKKLSSLKDEKEAAIERADEAEQRRKDADAKVDAVSSLSLSLSPPPPPPPLVCHLHTHPHTPAEHHLYVNMDIAPIKQ